MSSSQLSDQGQGPREGLLTKGWSDWSLWCWLLTRPPQRENSIDLGLLLSEGLRIIELLWGLCFPLRLSLAWDRAAQATIARQSSQGPWFVLQGLWEITSQLLSLVWGPPKIVSKISADLLPFRWTFLTDMMTFNWDENHMLLLLLGEWGLKTTWFKWNIMVGLCQAAFTALAMEQQWLRPGGKCFGSSYMTLLKVRCRTKRDHFLEAVL